MPDGKYFNKGGGILENQYTCERIWRGYQTYASCTSVIRKGFELMGATNIINDELDLKSTFMRRGDSTLEHQAKTAWLASAFMSNFPDFFGKNITCETSPEVWTYLTTALCHDAGEAIIGDIPDDGNPLHDAKDAAELEAFQDLIYAFSFFDRKGLLKVFKSFQKKDSHPARAIFALDKTEAILTNLMLEKCGIYGSIKVKNNPTERDLHFAEVSGSDLAADIWGAQMLTQFKGFPQEITQPVCELLNVAAKDVRGKYFSWLNY